MTTYPMGYEGRLVSLDELRARHEPKMHPEFARRWFAAVIEADGLVGIGGGWRSSDNQIKVFLERHYQVSSGGCCSYDGKRWALKPGMAHAASPLNSFHESQKWASGVVGYQAIDLVGRGSSGPQSHTVAQNWMRDNGARFGLMTAWNWGVKEPWHVQCSDVPRSVIDWRSKGSKDPVRWELPGDVPPEEDETMLIAFRRGTPGDPEPVYEQTGGMVTYVTEARWAQVGHRPVEVKPAEWFAQLILVGPTHPDFPQHASRFRAQVL